MKRIVVFILCLVTLFVIGCSKQKETVLPKRTVISGKVKHMEAYPTTKELFAEVIDFRDRKSVFKGTINEDGTFHIEFDLYATQDIKVEPVVGIIIAHPGDSIFVDVDFNDVGSVYFSGDRCESNRALFKYLNSNYGANSFYNPDKLDIDSYRLYCDRIQVDALEKQKNFIREVNPPKEIGQWTSDLIKIDYYNSILSYPRNYFMRDENGYKNWVDSTHYYDFLDGIEGEFKDFGRTVVNTVIYKLLENFDNILFLKSFKDLPTGVGITFKKHLDIIIEKTSTSVFRQMILGNLFYQFLCANYTEPFNEQKLFLDKNLHVPFIKQPLYYYYNNLKQNIENPQIASNAILSEMGVNGRELLNSIIAENKGKVLYVDIWATWCGPCLEGMKIAKELIPKLEGKEIEFVFVCVNSTKENWKATLSRFQIGGKHYFCNQEQSKDIRRGLGIEGIPHYILINKHGQIVESDSSDPNSPGTIDKIEKFLNQK
jgi:thiol-disulfide isomerase/thioredoxin